MLPLSIQGLFWKYNDIHMHVYLYYLYTYDTVFFCRGPYHQPYRVFYIDRISIHTMSALTLKCKYVTSDTQCILMLNSNIQQSFT